MSKIKDLRAMYVKKESSTVNNARLDIILITYDKLDRRSSCPRKNQCLYLKIVDVFIPVTCTCVTTIRLWVTAGNKGLINYHMIQRKKLFEEFIYFYWQFLWWCLWSKWWRKWNHSHKNGESVRKHGPNQSFILFILRNAWF